MACRTELRGDDGTFGSLWPFVEVAYCMFESLDASLEHRDDRVAVGLSILACHILCSAGRHLPDATGSAVEILAPRRVVSREPRAGDACAFTERLALSIPEQSALAELGDDEIDEVGQRVRTRDLFHIEARDRELAVPRLEFVGD